MAKQNQRKQFVQARLKALGGDATPELKAKLRQRFNKLSETKEGRTKIAKVLLPGGTAAERKALKQSLKPVKTSTTSTTGTSSATGTGSTTDTGSTNKVVTPKYVPGYFGIKPSVSVPGILPTPTTSTTVPKSTTSTTVPKSTTSTTVPKSTTSTTVPKTQSNAFKSFGPSSASSNKKDEKDFTTPIVAGILATGAAAVGTKKFLSSTSHIDKMLRVRQNELARQFKASQLTNSSTLSLADRPQFGTVAQQRAAAAAKAAAARPQFGTVADQRAAAAAKAAAASTYSVPAPRSALENVRAFFGGGLRKSGR